MPGLHWLVAVWPLCSRFLEKQDCSRVWATINRLLRPQGGVKPPCGFCLSERAGQYIVHISVIKVASTWVVSVDCYLIGRICMEFAWDMAEDCDHAIVFRFGVGGLAR